MVKWWRVFGYPFNNKRYLESKEKELELDVPVMELPPIEAGRGGR